MVIAIIVVWVVMITSIRPKRTQITFGQRSGGLGLSSVHQAPSLGLPRGEKRKGSRRNNANISKEGGCDIVTIVCFESQIMRFSIGGAMIQTMIRNSTLLGHLILLTVWCACVCAAMLPSHVYDDTAGAAEALYTNCTFVASTCTNAAAQSARARSRS